MQQGMSHGRDFQPGLQCPKILNVRIGASSLHYPGHLWLQVPEKPHRRGLAKRHQPLAGGDGTEQRLMEKRGGAFCGADTEYRTNDAEGHAKMDLSRGVETRIGFERGGQLEKTATESQAGITALASGAHARGDVV